MSVTVPTQYRKDSDLGWSSISSPGDTKLPDGRKVLNPVFLTPLSASDAKVLDSQLQAIPPGGVAVIESANGTLVSGKFTGLVSIRYTSGGRQYNLSVQVI